MVGLLRLPLVAGLFSAASVALTIPPQSSFANTGLESVETSLVQLYQENKDAIVRVKVAVKQAAAKGEEKVSLTVLTGFFIDPAGIVVTNAIPDQNVSRVWIEKSGHQYLAVALGSDPRSNIGLLQVAKPPSDLKYVNLDTEAESAAIGSLAFAITSPLDFDPTPKWGLVTGYESRFADISFPFTYSRVSITSGPAEGGSPVFDRTGNLLGISVAALPEVESSYLVPTKALQTIASSIRENRSFNHPTIHIEFDTKSLSSEGEHHLVVKRIEPNTPAAQSGIKVGDTLISINGVAAQSLNQVADQVFFSPRGEFLQLTVERNDEEIDFAVLLESVKN